MWSLHAPPCVCDGSLSVLPQSIDMHGVTITGDSKVTMGETVSMNVLVLQQTLCYDSWDRLLLCIRLVTSGGSMTADSWDRLSPHVVLTWIKEVKEKMDC